jgi:MmgE/PrpD N-terminal domain
LLIAGATYETLPDDAQHWARVAILDTVGCTLAGASEPCARIVERVATAGATTGQCLVFGTDHRVAALDAALINGTAAHALDFDDCSNTLGGHPSAPILPALFALAETRAVDGRDFIAAYVARETKTRVARGINFHHYEKGWHATATIGVFGSADSGCRLLDRDGAGIGCLIRIRPESEFRHLGGRTRGVDEGGQAAGSWTGEAAAGRSAGSEVPEHRVASVADGSGGTAADDAAWPAWCGGHAWPDFGDAARGGNGGGSSASCWSRAPTRRWLRCARADS